jgi:hypothetical protein
MMENSDEASAEDTMDVLAMLAKQGAFHKPKEGIAAV